MNYVFGERNEPWVGSDRELVCGDTGERFFGGGYSAFVSSDGEAAS